MNVMALPVICVSAAEAAVAVAVAAQKGALGQKEQRGSKLCNYT